MSQDDQTKQLQPSVLAVDRHEFIQAFNEESSLAGMENSTYETLWPHGLRHLWTGPPTIQPELLYLLLRDDRRAQARLFSSQSIAAAPSRAIDMARTEQIKSRTEQQLAAG